MKNKPISAVAIFLLATTAVTLLFWGINKISPDPKYEVEAQPSPIDDHLNKPETKLRPSIDALEEMRRLEQERIAKERAETNTPFTSHTPDDNAAPVGISTKKHTLEELTGSNVPETPKKKPAQPEKPEDEEKKEQHQKPMNESTSE